MEFDRRAFLRLIGTACLGANLSASPPDDAAAENRALLRALSYLAKVQSPDGAWRSAHYGFFREGDALTPLILLAFAASPAGPIPGAALERGAQWLNALTDRIAPQAEPWLQLRYPLFTASYAARFYVARGDAQRVAIWVRCIERLQLTAELGWAETDPRLGGWSDAPMPPHRPPDAPNVPNVPDMLNPNISATALALLALAAVGKSPALQRAESFVLRCQNFAPNEDRSSHPAAADERLDDGGFFFALGDPARSKAGPASLDRHGRERLRSYGSATCDGALALVALGHQAGHPNLNAATAWLRKRSSLWVHPGDWPVSRADSARALLFYYTQAMTEVLRQTAPSWAPEAKAVLASGLCAAQRPDGSWVNPETESCEDDPLLATAFAIQSLSRSSP